LSRASSKSTERVRFKNFAGGESGPTALLQDFSTWLEGAAVDLHFDWLAMNSTCSKVWKILVESLVDDPDWNNYRHLAPNPFLTLAILKEAAFDEEKRGKIARDGANFAPFLRKVCAAIRSCMIEVHKIERKHYVKVLDVKQPLVSTMYVGDLCLNKPLDAVKSPLGRGKNKGFAHVLNDGNHYTGALLMDNMYANWDEQGARVRTKEYVSIAKFQFYWNMLNEMAGPYGKFYKDYCIPVTQARLQFVFEHRLVIPAKRDEVEEEEEEDIFGASVSGSQSSQ
jgi:hypothetical protein